MKIAVRLILVVGLFELAFDASARGADFPRFGFQTGEHYIYQRRVRVTDLEDRPQALHTQQIQLWCLEREGDNATLLLELAAAVDGKAVSEGGLVLTVDRRGRKQMETEYATQLDGLDPLWELFPEFPDFLHTANDWTDAPDRYGRLLEYRDIGSDEEFHSHRRIDFEQRDPTGVAAALGRTRTGTIWMSPDLHVVSRRREQRIDPRADQKTESELMLYEKRAVTPEWLRLRGPEIRRYLQALNGADRIRDEMLRPGGDDPQAPADLQRLWRDYRVSIPPDQGSPLRRFAEAQLRRLTESGGELREQAALARRWLAAPAAHWSLQDASGQTLQSEAFRDRTTLEVFWSAESDACLRSFAPLRELALLAGDERLHIVCINVDRGLEAAQNAAAGPGAGLTHVFAGPPVGGELPRTLPIWRVLDSDSRVLRIAFGWQPAPNELVEPFLNEVDAP